MIGHYDVVIAGTGAGGGTLANVIAASGKRILLLERGNFLPREKANWDSGAVFVDGRYISKDTWYDADGEPLQPQVHYFVGGATKLYGAANAAAMKGEEPKLTRLAPRWSLEQVARPRHPSKWSRACSARSEPPSTRYMIFSGAEPSRAWSAARSRIHRPNVAASSR